MKPLESMGSRKDAPKRPPLRTIAEFAREVGVTSAAMSAFISRDANAPKPAIRQQGNIGACPRNFYPLPELRKWWASRQAKD